VLPDTDEVDVDHLVLKKGRLAGEGTREEGER
jgi:hypothetical protein